MKTLTIASLLFLASVLIAQRPNSTGVCTYGPRYLVTQLCLGMDLYNEYQQDLISGPSTCQSTRVTLVNEGWAAFCAF